LKKIFFILLIGLIIFAWFSSKKTSPFLNYELEGKSYRLLTAKNSTEWAKGLMNYRNKKELKGADGMIFIFPDKEIRSFWNENTYLDLDVYWIDGDKVVGKDFLPSIEKSKEVVIIESKTKVDKVIEIVK
jgi:uncharacterized membrane protein (UPF0127 family)